MEGSINELSKWRMECAARNLEAARYAFSGEQFETSVNRSYYSIFHALRAVTVLEGFDSKKHSGIISFFNEHFVKEGVFDKSVSKLVRSAFQLRSNADYRDFYVVSRTEAENQIEAAEEVIDKIKPYLEERWSR